MTLLLVLLPVAAYVVGSISFAWLAGRLKGIDLRQHGSGNLGATNAGRVLGMRWFVAVFCCDVLKGLLPVLAARWAPSWLGLPPEGATATELALLPIATGAAAIAGHVFTLFHGFRGGKAVATSLGVLIGLVPLLAACLFGIWLLCWLIGVAVSGGRKSRAVGPASVLAALAAAPVHIVLEDDPFAPGARLLTAFIILLSVLVVWRHRSNIRDMLTARRATSPGPTGPVAAPEEGETQP